MKIIDLTMRSGKTKDKLSEKGFYYRHDGLAKGWLVDP